MKTRIPHIATTICCLLLLMVTQAKAVNLVPGGGIGSMVFAPDCSLGQLYVDDETARLSFRKRIYGNSWQGSESVAESYGLDYFSGPDNASLFYISRGGTANWEAYVLEFDFSGYTIVRYLRDNSGNWSQAEKSSYIVDVAADMKSPTLFASALGSDNIVHFAVLGDNMELRYVTFDGSGYAIEIVTEFKNRTVMEGFDSPQQFRPRNLSLALGDGNAPHLVYSVDQKIEPVSGGTRQTSKLFYATRSGSSWKRTTLIDPGTKTDDAGLGASIAVAPNGTVGVAATYLPRAATGSPGVAQLRYLFKKGSSSWKSQTITKSSDGYRSKDGERGTGLYPYLQFDGSSSPHIIFTDHASEHAGTAWSYSGQLRYASRKSATTGSWSIKTIIKQPTKDAYLRRLDYPVIAASSKQCGNRVAAYAVKAEETTLSSHFHWLAGSEPPPPPPPPEVDAMTWMQILLLK